METMNELVWEMDKMLEEAKKNPMRIIYDFNDRFEIWENQILKNRLSAIIQLDGDPDYIERMINLTVNDYDRLVKRAQKEFYLDHNTELYHKRNQNLLKITKETIQLYKEQNHE